MFFSLPYLDCLRMIQPLFQLHKNIDFLLLEACKGGCDDDPETPNRFWDMVNKNPEMLPEMRTTHETILTRGVNGAIRESQTVNETERVKTFVTHFRSNLKSPV